MCSYNKLKIARQEHRHALIQLSIARQMWDQDHHAEGKDDHADKWFECVGIYLQQEEETRSAYYNARQEYEREQLGEGQWA